MKINNAERNNPRSNNNSFWKVILVYGSSTQFQARNVKQVQTLQRLNENEN